MRFIDTTLMKFFMRNPRKLLCIYRLKNYHGPGSDVDRTLLLRCFLKKSWSTDVWKIPTKPSLTNTFTVNMQCFASKFTKTAHNHRCFPRNLLDIFRTSVSQNWTPKGLIQWRNNETKEYFLHAELKSQIFQLLYYSKQFLLLFQEL